MCVSQKESVRPAESRPAVCCLFVCLQCCPSPRSDLTDGVTSALRALFKCCKYQCSLCTYLVVLVQFFIFYFFDNKKYK